MSSTDDDESGSVRSELDHKESQHDVTNDEAGSGAEDSFGSAELVDNSIIETGIIKTDSQNTEEKDKEEETKNQSIIPGSNILSEETSSQHSKAYLENKLDSDPIKSQVLSVNPIGAEESDDVFLQSTHSRREEKNQEEHETHEAQVEEQCVNTRISGDLVVESKSGEDDTIKTVGEDSMHITKNNFAQKDNAESILLQPEESYKSASEDSLKSQVEVTGDQVTSEPGTTNSTSISKVTKPILECSQLPSTESSQNSTPEKVRVKKRTATGTIEYSSYFDGPEDKLVSRLVSNFESQMNGESKTQSLSRGRHDKITSADLPNTNIESINGSDCLKSGVDSSESERLPAEISAGAFKVINSASHQGDKHSIGLADSVSLNSEMEENSKVDTTGINVINDQGLKVNDENKHNRTKENISKLYYTNTEVSSLPVLNTAVENMTDLSINNPSANNFPSSDQNIMAGNSNNPGTFNEDIKSYPSSASSKVELAPIVKAVSTITNKDTNIIFGVCVVGFHHIRGPEVEYWKGPEGDQSGLWPYLPFQSLPDGSHAQEESFCYFTLLYDTEKCISVNPTPERDEEGHIIEKSDFKNVVTLFGIACNRQIRAEQLKNTSDDVTRSIVQKSVVVIAKKPIFGPIKEKLALVTRAYFFQGDFEDRIIIDNLYDNLRQIFSVKLEEDDLAIGMPLRELLYRLGHKVLILIKALLLERRILFFASNTELLCASQFSLVTLIPNLVNHLEDCGSPLLSTYETKLKKPTSLRTSDRESLLAFMGLPLQIFAAGGLFSPYVPLQQLAELKAEETKYFMIGSTNSLVLGSNYGVMDIFVNVINKDLNAALQLSSTDKKWINGLVDSVKNTWDPDDHWGPKDFGFKGSEDYIRLQFEEYLMFLLSSVKYDSFLSKQTVPLSALQARPNITGNPLKLFNMSWVELWKRTNNYRIFNKFTDGELFDIVEPRHPGENNGELGQKDGFGKSVTKAFGNLWNKEEKQKDTRGNYGKELHTATSSKEPSLSSRNPSIISRTASIGAVSMQSIVDEPNTPFYESPSPIGKPEGHRSMSSVASDISSVSSGAKDLTPSRTTTGYFSSWSSWAADKRKNLFAKKIVSEVPDENLNSTEGSIKSIDLSRD